MKYFAESKKWVTTRVEKNHKSQKAKTKGLREIRGCTWLPSPLEVHKREGRFRAFSDNAEPPARGVSSGQLKATSKSITTTKNLKEL